GAPTHGSACPGRGTATSAVSHRTPACSPMQSPSAPQLGFGLDTVTRNAPVFQSYQPGSLIPPNGGMLWPSLYAPQATLQGSSPPTGAFPALSQLFVEQTPPIQNRKPGVPFGRVPRQEVAGSVGGQSRRFLAPGTSIPIC